LKEPLDYNPTVHTAGVPREDEKAKKKEKLDSIPKPDLPTIAAMSEDEDKQEVQSNEPDINSVSFRKKVYKMAESKIKKYVLREIGKLKDLRKGVGKKIKKKTTTKVLDHYRKRWKKQKKLTKTHLTINEFLDSSRKKAIKKLIRRYADVLG